MPEPSASGEWVLFAGRLFRARDLLEQLLPGQVHPYYPDSDEVTYDPLQDNLDDPFPEELR